MLKTRWPLLLALLLFFAALAVLLQSSLNAAGGHFGYPMDDTYIHMAMARNFGFHGVWGVTPYQFSSSSSSLLFTGLLAAIFRLTGQHDATPFLLNCVLAVILLAFCDFLFRRAALLPRQRFLLLLVIAFAMPLPAMVYSGMEHILQTVLILIFVYVAAGLLTGETAGTAALPVWAALLVLARYEGAFLVFAAACLFALRRRWLYAALFSLAGALPIALFGIYSLQKGWYAVPVSLLAKANINTQFGGRRFGFLLNGAVLAYKSPHVTLLMLIAAILLWMLYRRQHSIWTRSGVTSALFLITAVLHLQLASVGWYFRYEAYLVVWGIYACVLAAQELPLPYHAYRNSYLASAAILAIAFGTRAVAAWNITPGAVRNIYQQQYQFGRFIAKYYGGKAVVLNDIGAVAYLSDAKILDYFGLGTVEVSRAKLEHRYDVEFERRFAREKSAQMAIVYPAMYTVFGGLPKEWEEVGSWTVPEHAITFGDTVIIYSLDPAGKEYLVRSLQDFSRELPPEVVERGQYKTIRPK